MTTHIANNPTWERWRAILDRIIAHPDYRYGARYNQHLGKLARFAFAQMAAANTTYWLIHARAAMLGETTGGLDT